MEHKCGIIGIIGMDIINSLITGLNHLQHRGYESAGISFVDNDNIMTHKNIGLVEDVFHNYQPHKSALGLGHVRYSTTKKDQNKFLEEAQPLSNNNFAIAHNGNISFIQNIKDSYQIQTNNNSDTVILMKFMELLQTKYDNIENILKHIIINVTGTYSLVILTKNQIYGLRDRYGIRPLTLMQNKSNRSLCLTSETVAFNENDYIIIRDIRPGEIISINLQCQYNTIYQHAQINYNFCSFEYIYFMHHQSKYNDNSVEDLRYKLGYELGLAEKDLYPNNIVIPVPNSSIPASQGFADAIKSHCKHHILKNSEIKRTFILPTDEARKKACSQKFLFIDGAELFNKNIYLIDDSIVRGTTIKYIIKKLQEFNPKTINIRITSPPVIGPCFYGIDMSTKEELIITNKNIDDIRKELDVSSLNYLNINSMTKIFNHPVCTSCFSGEYDKKLLEW